MSIQRQFDATRLNEIVNMPGVREWVASPHAGEIDLSSVVQDQRHFWLAEGQSGGVLFTQVEECIYEAHTNFAPDFRGAAALRATREAISWMFLQTYAMELWTRVPKHNRRAAIWARLIGGQPSFGIENSWLTSEGEGVGVQFYRLGFWEWWAQTQNVWLETIGTEFHLALEMKKKEAGIVEEKHGDFTWHDRAVGAVVVMIRAGIAPKALAWYNRWAKLAGFLPIGVWDWQPLVLDFGAYAVVIKSDGDFDIFQGGVKCQ